MKQKIRKLKSIRQNKGKKITKIRGTEKSKHKQIICVHRTEEEKGITAKETFLFFFLILG